MPNISQKKIQKGKFISFEGGEGSGKTTITKMIYEFLLKKNYKIVSTREIGGTEISEKIREFIFTNNLSKNAELLMVMAARVEHVENFIKEKLRQNNIVLCDRYVDSTACYQGNFNDDDIDKIYNLHDELIGLLPDKTFILISDPEIGLERAIKRGQINKFELKPMSFHKNIHDIYLKIAEKFPDRICVIDTNFKNIDEVFNIILSQILKII